MSTGTIDPDFLALPLRLVADAALGRARELGAEHADVRIGRTTRQLLRLRDGTVATARDSTTVGLAVRVIVDGTWGFASHLELTAQAAAATAQRAVEVARTLSPLNAERVELAAEPVHTDAVWVGDHEIDPFTVPLHEKVALLSEWSRRLLAADGVEHTEVTFQTEKEIKFYADSAGTSTTQQRVRIHPSVTATAVDRAAGSFESMRTCGPP
ncbi:MAG: PmbA/TldA family metallopeptidase, partial [Solirubrobacteraceae bacterium]